MEAALDDRLTESVRDGLWYRPAEETAPGEAASGMESQEHRIAVDGEAQDFCFEEDEEDADDEDEEPEQLQQLQQQPNIPAFELSPDEFRTKAKLMHSDITQIPSRLRG